MRYSEQSLCLASHDGMGAINKFDCRVVLGRDLKEKKKRPQKNPNQLLVGDIRLCSHCPISVVALFGWVW